MQTCSEGVTARNVELMYTIGGLDWWTGLITLLVEASDTINACNMEDYYCCLLVYGILFTQ